MNPQDKIGRYRLDEELELSGLGEFWRGTDTLSGETVLVQVIPFARLGDAKYRSELFQRLNEQQRGGAEPAHPDLRRVLGASRTEDFLFVFHEWRVGQSLASMLVVQAQPFGPEKVAALLSSVGQALEQVHERGQIYGRLSPVAVWLDEAGAYLADLGLAPILLEATERMAGTMTHPEFLAPEQVSGKQADALTDSYALGVLAYRLLTGAYPVQAETQGELLDNILYQEPTAPETIEPALHPNTSRVLLKALSKEPQARFQSPTLFTVSLAKTLIQEEAMPPVSAPRPSTSVTAPVVRRSRSRRLAGAIGSGWRQVLGLGEGDSMGRQERALLLAAGLATLLALIGWVVYLAQPMSRVRERMELGQLEEAEALLSRLRSRWEGDPDLSVLSAELDFRLERYEQAVAAFLEVLRDDPELLREAGVEPLLIRLYLARPADAGASELACQSLEWSRWRETASRVGLGDAQRAARFLQLLMQCGRHEEASAMADELADRLLRGPGERLATALLPLAGVARSVSLDRALGRLLLRQGMLAEAAEILRRAFESGDARQTARFLAEDLLEALERHPSSRELRSLMVDQQAWLEEGLRQRMQHPDALVRLGALRALEAAGVPVDLSIESRLSWQLEEAMALGSSPDLDELVSRLEADDGPEPPPLAVLAKYHLWRRDYSRSLEQLGRALERSPELAQDDEVQGMLLMLLGQSWSRLRWLELLGPVRAPELLDLAMLSPDPRLRERAAELARLLGRLDRRPAQLIVELRDPRTPDVLAVAKELRWYGTAAGRNALGSLMARTRDPWLRSRLRELLQPAGS